MCIRLKLRAKCLAMTKVLRNLCEKQDRQDWGRLGQLTTGVSGRGALGWVLPLPQVGEGPRAPPGAPRTSASQLHSAPEDLPVSVMHVSEGSIAPAIPEGYMLKAASLAAPVVKALPAMLETEVQALDQDDPLEEGMVTHSSILAWRIPWTEEPGGLQSKGLQRAGYDWSDLAHTQFSSLGLKIFDLRDTHGPWSTQL